MFETEDGKVFHSFNFRDVLGKTIVCEDGVARRVEQISYSHRYADMVLLNEVNEDETPGGAYCHVLSLNCQMFGKPLPTPEQKAAFSRIFRRAIRMRWDNDVGDGQHIRLPSGLIVRRG